jgi:hypothetical protein
LLERELANGDPQDCDVLVRDTFSSDSIPVHLLTREAFAVHLKHFTPEGIIAAQITNLPLDLQPVLWQLAQYYDLSIEGLTMTEIQTVAILPTGFCFRAMLRFELLRMTEIRWI